MDVTQLFAAIADGNVEAVSQQLDQAPWLIHVPNPNTDAWDEFSVLHCAAKNGQLEVTKLLVDRGAAVYSHPHNSYPAVIIAAWNKHKDVVDYYLQQIPDKADGTNGLGVTINLAARQGLADLERRHIEADSLAVHHHRLWSTGGASHDPSGYGQPILGN